MSVFTITPTGSTFLHFFFPFTRLSSFLAFLGGYSLLYVFFAAFLVTPFLLSFLCMFCYASESTLRAWRFG